MMNVKITKSLMPDGPDRGAAILVLDFSGDGEAMEKNDIIEQVLNVKLPNVVMKGKLIDNPDLRELAAGFVQKHKRVTFITDASDDIQTLRTLRNVNLILKVIPPTPESNDIRPSNFPLLRQNDMIILEVKDKDAYERAKKFVGTRTITQPIVSFSVSKVFKDLAEVIEMFQHDSEFWTFRSRLTTPGAISLKD